MKKVLSFTAIAALAALAACGPSQEEIEARNKAIRDSIVADSTKKADEMAQRMKDSTDQANMAAEAAAKKMADSLHEDSVKRKLIKEKK